jgi:hypothetical protein
MAEENEEEEAKAEGKFNIKDGATTVPSKCTCMEMLL